MSTIVLPAGSGSATPSGPAGGSLSGSYPDPGIAALAVGTAQLAASAVTNAKVAAGAAIAGTKIAPDFGGQTVATTGFIGVGAVGAGLPTIGDVRFGEATVRTLIAMRSTGGAGDYTLFATNLSNVLYIGGDAGGSNVLPGTVFNGTVGHFFRVNGTGVVNITSNSIILAQPVGIGVNANPPTITSSNGTPEGAVTAPVGSIYLRGDGGAGTSLYVKQSGSGNTGWVGK